MSEDNINFSPIVKPCDSLWKCVRAFWKYGFLKGCEFPNIGNILPMVITYLVLKYQSVAEPEDGQGFF
jgi:hypothetical protein